jgi:hypothetical protein
MLSAVYSPRLSAFFIFLRRTRRFPAVYPAAAVRHCRTLTRRLPPRCAARRGAGTLGSYVLPDIGSALICFSTYQEIIIRGAILPLVLWLSIMEACHGPKAAETLTWPSGPLLSVCRRISRFGRHLSIKLLNRWLWRRTSICAISCTTMYSRHDPRLLGQFGLKPDPAVGRIAACFQFAAQKRAPRWGICNVADLRYQMLGRDKFNQQRTHFS